MYGHMKYSPIQLAHCNLAKSQHIFVVAGGNLGHFSSGSTVVLMVPYWDYISVPVRDVCKDPTRVNDHVCQCSITDPCQNLQEWALLGLLGL